MTEGSFQDKPMIISIVICTYNRCESLRETLESLRKISVPADFPWELIVVDNNSIDGTRKVVEDFIRTSDLSVRYVFEATQGLSHARNKGVREAKGEILSFIDDDVIVGEDWLAEVKRAFDKYNAAYIGGKVLLKKDLPRPEWWHERYNETLGEFDIGNSVVFADEGYTGIVGIGANMSFKRGVFEKYGLFRTDLGRTGNSVFMGEEIDFCERLRARGDLAIYYPDAIVYHCPDTERMTREYLRRWYFRVGEWSYLVNVSYKRALMITFKMPEEKYKSTTKNLLKAFIFRLNGKGREAFYNEIELIRLTGYLFGLIKNRCF